MYVIRFGKPELTRAVVGSLIIDMDKRLVTRLGAAVRLTPKEYDLLGILARNAGLATHRQIVSGLAQRITTTHNACPSSLANSAAS